MRTPQGSLIARRTRRREPCSALPQGTPQAPTRLDAERVALVCEREILFYASQDLAFLGKKELPGVAVAAASQPGCTATLMADKRIVLHTGPSLAATQEGGLKQTALALSVAPDCKTVGLIHADASVSIFDAGTQQSKTIWRRPGLVPQQLAFGPRGERLLIVTEATVMLLGLRGARKVRSLSATSGGAWAQWLGPTSVALAGRDGLLALEVHAEKSRSLSDRPQGLRLAANRDGDPGWLCMTCLLYTSPSPRD